MGGTTKRGQSSAEDRDDNVTTDNVTTNNVTTNNVTATVGTTTFRTTTMVHLADKAHLDKATLARVNSAVMLALIGSGLAACAVGAIVFDVGRLFAAW